MIHSFLTIQEDCWYSEKRTLLAYLLLPLSCIFYFLIRSRYFLYRTHFFKRYSFSRPLIVIGNVTVGGTGKTPFVIWLADFLKAKGMQPGIVTRGVGGKKHKRPQWVNRYDDPKQVGDEAILLAKRTACPVVIGIDRVAAVNELLKKTACDIVLSDDGLQHYRMNRDIEIAITDGQRQSGNGFLLPAGPLREPKSRLKKADFVVEQASHSREGGNPLSIDSRLCGNNMATHPWQMVLQGEHLFSVMEDNKIKEITDFLTMRLHAVAAIGNPNRFFSMLRHYGLDIIEHVFPDHFQYHKNDFDFSDSLPIVMTEKDAVKCRFFADERFWYLPVSAGLSKAFETALLSKLNTIKHDYA